MTVELERGLWRAVLGRCAVLHPLGTQEPFDPVLLHQAAFKVERLALPVHGKRHIRLYYVNAQQQRMCTCTEHVVCVSHHLPMLGAAHIA